MSDTPRKPPFDPDISMEKRQRPLFCGLPRFGIGIVCIILVTFLWVGSGFLTKTILTDFDKPFFLSYLSCFCFQIYYLFLWIPDPLDPSKNLPEVSKNSTSNTLKTEECHTIESIMWERESASTPVPAGKSPIIVGKKELEQEKPRLTLPDIVKVGVWLFFLYFAANYSCNLSFKYTSVSSSTIIATTSGIFLLFFGAIAGIDTITLLKFMAVMMSSSGAIYLLYSERNFGQFRTMGNLMSLGSSACYGLYSILLKKVVKQESRISTPILFAVVGTFSTLMLWPCFIILHVYKIEIFELPKRPLDLASIAVNVVFGSLLPNYLWNVAFLFTTPLVVAIGISFTVPTTLVLEYFYGKEPITSIYIISGTLVVCGFLLINLSTIYPQSDCGCRKLNDCCT